MCVFFLTESTFLDALTNVTVTTVNRNGSALGKNVTSNISQTVLLGIVIGAGFLVVISGTLLAVLCRYIIAK